MFAGTGHNLSLHRNLTPNSVIFPQLISLISLNLSYKNFSVLNTHILFKESSQ